MLQKCGWICLHCRECHIYQDKLDSIPCVAGKTHDIKAYAVKCAQCDKLGQVSTDITGEICSGSELYRAKQLQLQIQTAQAHAAKLELIKTLELERERLAELLYRKRSFGFLSKANAILRVPLFLQTNLLHFY